MLRKQGVGPEDLVAVRLASMRDTIVAVLAILKAGGAFIAIDPAAPAERRARKAQWPPWRLSVSRWYAARSQEGS